MKKVFVSSRFRGDTHANIETAKDLAREVIQMGHIPIMPHLYFPLFLNDADPYDRGVGLVAGLMLLKDCDDMVIYDDDGVSDGMAIEIAFWKATKHLEPKRWQSFIGGQFKPVN